MQIYFDCVTDRTCLEYVYMYMYGIQIHGIQIQKMWNKGVWFVKK